MTVYQLNGLDLPRTSRQQWNTGTPVSRRHLSKGDLVFFATNGGRRVSHVGLYAGDNQFIHAPRRGQRIQTASLANSYYKKRYLGARRYL
jgi:cell wall-associated NlpC family hydrolase